MDVLGLPIPLRILTMPKPPSLLADRLFLVIRETPPPTAKTLAHGPVRELHALRWDPGVFGGPGIPAKPRA